MPLHTAAGREGGRVRAQKLGHLDLPGPAGAPHQDGSQAGLAVQPRPGLKIQMLASVLSAVLLSPSSKAQ